MGMKVEEVMTKKVVWVDPNANITDAAKKMRSEKVGSVMVIEKGKLVGMITDKEITHEIVAKGLDPRQSKVEDFMSRDFIPVSSKMDLVKAAQLFQELAARRLPVVERNKPIGIISVSDIAAFVKECIDCILVEVGVHRKVRKQK